jgi:4-amino-4-deoxy-L-arabinose transferase-like glycosyltransferase
MLAAIAALAVLIFIIRLTAPPNLLDQDQERPSSYVLDAVKNGNWLCQRDLEGFITSKPPVWTWISAGATIAYGRINEFTLYLPGALGLFGIACLLFIYGRRYYGADVALIAAVASMLTSAGLKGFGLARTDAVFCLHG